MDHNLVVFTAIWLFVYRVGWENLVCEKMAERKDWWPALHFTRFHARKDSEVNPELLEVKSSLEKILCPGMFVCFSENEVI